MATSTPKPPVHDQPEVDHDVVGWDDAPQGKDVSWHPEPPAQPMTLWWRLWRRGRNALAAVVLLAMLLFCVWYIRGWHARRAQAFAERNTHVVQQIYAMKTAQAMYTKKYDVYASGAWRLHASGALIPLEFTDAFENWQNNGDSTTPVPWRGYIFRVLQGEAGAGATSLYKVPGDPGGGVYTYGVIARSVDPEDGDRQYFMGEGGTIYYHAEPRPGDPKYKQFLLDAVPDQSEWPTGWFTAK